MGNIQPQIFPSDFSDRLKFKVQLSSQLLPESTDYQIKQKNQQNQQQQQQKHGNYAVCRISGSNHSLRQGIQSPD